MYGEINCYCDYMYEQESSFSLNNQFRKKYEKGKLFNNKISRKTSKFPTNKDDR